MSFSLACCVIDEHQQRAGCTATLEPTMVAAVDLDQLAVGFTPQARLMKASAVLGRQPQPILDHPLAQLLSRDLDSVLLEQNLRRQARAEIGIARPNQFDHILADARNKPVVRGAATSLVDQRSAATIAIRGQQPARLPRAQLQNRRRRNLSASPSQNFGKNLFWHFNFAETRQFQLCAYKSTIRKAHYRT